MKYLKIAILIVVLGTSLWAAQEIVRDDTDGTPRTPSRLVPLWVTLDIAVASGTGTSTTYVEKIPLVWNATTKKLYASGVPLLFETVQSATYPSAIVLSSETIGLMTRLASILSSLASDAYGLKIHDTGTATLPLQASTATIGSVSLTLSHTMSHYVATSTVGVSTAVVPLANRRWISMKSSGTFAITVGSTTVPWGATENYNARIPDAAPDVPVGFTTTATASRIDIYQGGN